MGGQSQNWLSERLALRSIAIVKRMWSATSQKTCPKTKRDSHYSAWCLEHLSKAAREDARRLLLIIDTRVSHASCVSAVSLGLQGLTSSKTTYSRAKSSSKFGPSAPSLTCDYFTETLDCMLVSVIDQASKGAFKLKCLVKLKSGIR